MTDNERLILITLHDRRMNVPQIAKYSTLPPNEIRKALNSLQRLGLICSSGEGSGHKNFRLVTRVTELADRLLKLEFNVKDIERKLGQN
ncbi:MAG TPA: hypothetical protein VJ487_15085 [Alphaproteobacteria bacterium]|nr:hypothetical protein [Alphaproteobacteria bacterium]